MSNHVNNQGFSNNNQNPGHTQPNANDDWMDTNQQNFMNPGNSGPSNFNNPAWECNTNQQNFNKEKPYNNQGFKKGGPQYKDKRQNNKSTPKAKAKANIKRDYTRTHMAGAVTCIMRGMMRFHYEKQHKNFPSMKFQDRLRKILTKKLATLCPPSCSVKEMHIVYIKHIRDTESNILKKLHAELQEDIVHNTLDQSKGYEPFNYKLISTLVNGKMKGIMKFHYVNQNKPIPTIKFQNKLRDIIIKKMILYCPAFIKDLKEIHRLYTRYIRSDEINILAEAKAALIEDNDVNKYLGEIASTDDEDESAKPSNDDSTEKSEAHKVMNLMKSLFNKGQEVKEIEQGENIVQPGMAEVDQVLIDAIENRLHDVQIDFNLKLTSFPVSSPLNELKELLKYFKVTAMEKTNDKTYVISCDAHRTFDKLLATNSTGDDMINVERVTQLPDESNNQMHEDFDKESDINSSEVECVKSVREKDSDITKEVEELLAENENEIGDDW